MRAAVERRTAGGKELGTSEALTPERALALFTTPAERPGGPSREIRSGAAADLVLGRAGAMTVSELAATGTPAVLVPLDLVGQRSNAAALAAVGGAEVVAQAEVGSLPAVIGRLGGDRERLAAMGRAAATLGFTDAAGTVADAVMEAVHG